MWCKFQTRGFPEVSRAPVVLFCQLCQHHNQSLLIFHLLELCPCFMTPSSFFSTKFLHAAFWGEQTGETVSVGLHLCPRPSDFIVFCLSYYITLLQSQHLIACNVCLWIKMVAKAGPGIPGRYGFLRGHLRSAWCTTLSQTTAASLLTALDVSADLTELGRTPVAVVSAGVKSILDIGRTLVGIFPGCWEWKQVMIYLVYRVQQWQESLVILRQLLSPRFSQTTIERMWGPYLPFSGSGAIQALGYS